MFYRATVEAIRREILAREPETKAAECALTRGHTPPLSHLLWMCDEIRKMETASTENAVQAARWVGWICAHLEMRGWWDNTVTRDLVRKDRGDRWDMPH